MYYKLLLLHYQSKYSNRIALSNGGTFLVVGFFLKAQNIKKLCLQLGHLYFSWGFENAVFSIINHR